MSDNNSTYEEFKVSGSNLVDKVKELIRAGNVRKIIIKRESGKTLLTIPLSAGVAVTAVSVVLAPTLVAVGAIAALFTKVTVVVERAPSDEEPVTIVDEDPFDSPS